jgi:Rrf2 family protein
MQITLQADYAIRAVSYLSRQWPDGRAATSKVAKEMKIPPSFLAKIISQLSIHGLLHTSRGARGGVTLAREPGKISMLEVVEAIDGPILLNECVGNPSECEFNEDCLVHPIWVEAQKSLVKRLSETRFDQMTVKKK